MNTFSTSGRSAAALPTGHGEVPLPPRPGFSPEDIPGNLAEAMKLRCIGRGQPIKASWLCLETLDMYRRHNLPADLALVETYQVLVLCYTDNIKNGRVDVVAEADAAMSELAALGGIPNAGTIHRRCTEGEMEDPAGELGGFHVRLTPRGAADPAHLSRPLRPGEPALEAPTARTPRMGTPLARFPAEAFPLRPAADGCVEACGTPGAAILVPDPVRLQARFEALYLQGVVCMSQALRVENTLGAERTELRNQELPYLAGGAWWMHLATLAALEAHVNPAECHRRARAKASMLIRRIQAGRHFEMAALPGADLLE